ncbi:glycosyltransferase family protein [Paenibacillus puerhi]|uniref:glycosyltransferase family protein n=1 Tax=Paenibacillus puerhi TaxID=2692622 RepID=UPI0013599A03|nr:glycosyltransferase [Paenibacillus puerhi]
MKILSAYEAGNEQAELLTTSLRDVQVEICRLGQQSIQEFQEADILHVHNASFIASHLSELSGYLERHPAVRFIHYDTSDIRTRKEAIRSNFYAHLASYNDDQVAANLQQLSALFPACFVKNAEAADYAAKYHKRVYILPYAVNLEDIAKLSGSREASNTTRPVIVHVAADDNKGTEFVEKAIRLLQQNGYSLHYERLEKLSQADVLAKLKEADIVIDQLLHGSYGTVSIEAMALGKPVISHIREDIKPKNDPALPVISANPATLYRTLLPLLGDSQRRQELGNAGRRFVESNHHINAVAEKLRWAYLQEAEYAKEGALQGKEQDGGHQVFDTFTGESYTPSHAAPVPEPAPPANQQQQPAAGNENKQPHSVPSIPGRAPKRSAKSRRTTRTKVSRRSSRRIKTGALRPNRYSISNGTGKNSATYLSFNVGKLASRVTITSAFIKLPVRTNKNKAVAIHRIKQNWSPDHSGHPLVFSRKIRKLSVRKSRRISYWPCTKLIRKWHKGRVNNYGVRIGIRLAKPPTLVFRYKR